MTKQNNIVDFWKDLRTELDIKYHLLGVEKQPKGNRENWIEGDISTIKSLLHSIEKEVEESKINIKKYNGTPTEDDVNFICGFNTGKLVDIAILKKYQEGR